MSILTSLEALLKVRKSYISETASRKTGQNDIQKEPHSLRLPFQYAIIFLPYNFIIKVIKL
ncbi:hypothetical protein DWV34_14800 [Anaerostipes sp. AF04-45]|nr:hypothetical protein DWV34_14800 [Anaerostipes sp. AF04-45]